MNYLLRKIKGHKWLKKSLTKEDLQILLTDLKPIDNKLSVYSVKNDNDIKIVITGLASTTREVKKVEYVLIEETDIETAGFSLEFNIGATALKSANSLHKDIMIKTEDDLIRLAKLMHAKGKQKVEPKPSVKKLLEDAHANKNLDISAMQHNLHLELNITCNC